MQFYEGGVCVARQERAGHAGYLGKVNASLAMPAVWTENTPAEVLRVACGDDCNTVVSGCWI